MDIIYFSDISQLDFVLNTHPDWMVEMHPMTSDMAVSFQLEKLHIEFIDAWDFIKLEDVEKNSKNAYSLSKTWWKEIVENSTDKADSLLSLSQQDMVYFFEACLNARTVYNRIFESIPIEKINGYFLPPVGVVRTGPPPVCRAVSSISQAVLFYIAKTMNISVCKLGLSDPLSAASMRSFNTVMSKNEKPLNGNKAFKKTIIIYETLMATREYTDLMAALDKLQDVNVISISQRILEGASRLSSRNLEIQHCLQCFWNSFNESANSYKGQYPEIFANPFLSFQFEAIKKEMNTAVAYGDVFDTFLDVLKPTLVVFGHEAFTRERLLVQLTRNRGIHTVSLLHGGLGFKFSCLGIIGDADSVLVWSDKNIEWLISNGINKSRLHKIGSLQCQKKYDKYVEKHEIANLCQLKRAAKKRLGLSQDKPLVAVLTAEINTGFCSPIADPNQHRSMIKEWLSLVDARQDLCFIIKPHPSFDYYELYRRLIDSCRPNLVFIEHISLDEVLEASDVCLMINYCTTAGLEAMLHRLPLIYLESAVYPISDWQDSLSESSMLRVATVAELERCIDCLLNDDAYMDKALVEADKEIKRILDINESSASERLLFAIKKIINTRHKGESDNLSNIQGVRDFLYSDDTNISKELSLLTKSHSGENLMHAFVYIAGANSLGVASVKRIFEIFHDFTKREGLGSWHSARWLLMPVYITANFKHWRGGDSYLSKLKLLMPYLIRPYRIASMPSSFWRFIGKELMKQSFAYMVIKIVLGYLRKVKFEFTR